MVAPAAMFLTVLEGMVYTIGAVFAAAALILVIIVIALNLTARLIAKVFAPKTGR